MATARAHSYRNYVWCRSSLNTVDYRCNERSQPTSLNEQTKISHGSYIDSPLFLIVLSIVQFSFRCIIEYSLTLPAGPWMTWTDTFPFHANTIIYSCDGTPDDTIKHSIHNKKNTRISKDQAHTEHLASRGRVMCLNELKSSFYQLMSTRHTYYI